MTKHFSLLLIATLLILSTHTHAKLYKWVDEDGNIHYSDKIVTEAVNHQRSELTKDGMETKRIDKAKSREMLMEEEKLRKEREKLLAEQQLLLQEQEAQDDALLRTFQSEEDIVRAKKSKLDAIDSKIKVDRSNIRGAKRQLAKLQKSAATSELQGKRVPKSLLDDIENLRQRIKDNYGSIIKREQEKADIKTSSYDDLKRFRELMNLQAGNPALEKAEEEDNSSLLDTVVLCKTLPICDALWGEAETYVRKHATTRIQMLSESIIITRSPVKTHDISLTVSMLRRDQPGETFLFFDVQCSETDAGKNHCLSDEVQNIRKGFKPAMEEKITE